MYKKILCTLLAALCTISLASCGNNTSSGDSGNSSGNSTADSGSANSDEEPYLVHFMYLVAAEGSNQAKINELANELTLQELNMNIDMMPMTFGAYNSTISTSLAAG